MAIFFQNGERGAWQGSPHVPPIAPLHPFFLVFPHSNYSAFAKKPTEHRDRTVSFKITSQGSDPAASCSPWLRQCSQNDVSGSLAQERAIGFSCM